MDLIEASEEGNPEIVRYLLQNETYSNDLKESALDNALGKGHFEVVRLLIENGANTRIDVILWIAARNGNLEMVRFLVQKGAAAFGGSSTIVRTWNDSALITAASNGHLDVVRFLLQKGANIQFENGLAFHLAAMNGHLEVARFLLENGADVHTNNDSALISAAGNDHLELVRFLLQNGANIHSKNDRPLQMAIKYGKEVEVVQFLLGAGANPDVLPENLQHLIPRVISRSEYPIVQPSVTSTFELPDRWILLAKGSTYVLPK